MRNRVFLAVGATALALAACGGGGGSDEPAATAQVPASASASVVPLATHRPPITATSEISTTSSFGRRPFG